MTDSQTPGLTPKARQTRAHILSTALALFATRGYQETTLRDIAAAADCSLGLTYRYFARKEELVLALYRQLAGELEEEVKALPPMPLAQRFAYALRSDLVRLAPHRVALGALFGAGLAPDSDVAVMGERVADIREQVWRAFLTVILEATDRPKERQAQSLATAFYAVHLMAVLFWLQDRSPGQQATQDLLALGEEMLTRLRPVLRLPLVARYLARLARILGPLFGQAV